MSRNNWLSFHLQQTRSLLALSPVLTRPSGDPDNSGNPWGGRTHGRNKKEGKYSLIIIRNYVLAERAWIIQYALSVILKEHSAAINKTEVEWYMLVWNNCQHILLSKKTQACVYYFTELFMHRLLIQKTYTKLVIVVTSGERVKCEGRLVFQPTSYCSLNLL